MQAKENLRKIGRRMQKLKNEDKKGLNSSSGITLVALVVTVVVLLILAGITLVYVFGDNGVFGKATQAKVQTELGKIEEQVGMIYYDKLMANQGTSNKVTNRDIVEELNKRGNKIEIRSAGVGSVTGISLEPATVSIDQSQTTTIKVKIERPEDVNFYYAVIDGKYYKMNFQNNAVTIERKASDPEETANIEIETGYDATIVTNAQINQSEKTIEIKGGAKGGTTELTVKYGSKTAKCTVNVVDEIDKLWAEIAEMAKAIANDSSITNSSPQATVNVNGASKTIKVGDILNVKYDGAIRRVRVLGFKHDDLVNNGAYGGDHTKASISFEFYDLMTGNTYMAMNSTNTNANGWGSSDMRRDLNGYEKNATTGLIADEQSGAIGGLGAKLSNKGYIKQVKKSYIKEYGNANSIYKDNDSTKGKNYAQDYLWLLACSEVVNAGYQANAYGYAITTEGNQYKYYQGVTEAWNANSPGRVKYIGSALAIYCWLRSPRFNDASGFCCIYYYRI